VTSTAADATLSVADTASIATGRLVNGSFSLAKALEAKVGARGFAPVGGSGAPTTLIDWTGPVANASTPVDFKQSIGASEPLRTGTYSKTLTLTLSTTAP
jgi:alkaline phosphatase